MPEFILNAPHWFPKPRTQTEAARWSDLRDFACGYVEALFFTNGDSGDEDEFSLNELGADRLTRAAKIAILEDCGAFLSATVKTGPLAGLFVRQILDNEPGDDEQAGRDFWFTRQGHGVGFWDREDDTWSEAARDALSEAARSFRERTAFRQRGWVYYE
jgi:hypothetical protein